MPISHEHTARKAILHIDGDAFFASCEQSRNPALQGRPVVTGKERGIAASLSYEAKARGVTRAMPLYQIKKICPDVVILPSDYETYSLLSQRLYQIVRRYTPDVEEYGIDECFADLTGLRRIHHCSYRAMAEKIQAELRLELGFTFSIGLAPTKVLAKIGSKWQKPHGLTVIADDKIADFLTKLKIGEVWGIGPQTAAFLNKFQIQTAQDFAQKPLSWVQEKCSKPYQEIWHELNGQAVLPLVTQEKTGYQSIQKFKTFTPPSTQEAFVFAQLSRNLENACAKARRYQLAARRVYLILRTQQFQHAACEIQLERPTALPHEILPLIHQSFTKLFRAGVEYRATGVVLFNLVPEDYGQLDLFGAVLKSARVRQVYAAVDVLNRKYGKYTVGLGSSLTAHQFAQHEGGRGDAPQRKDFLFKGETTRQRLNIPMLWWKV